MPTKKLRGQPPTDTGDINVRDVFSGSKVHMDGISVNHQMSGELESIYGKGRKNSTEMGDTDITWDEMAK